MDFIRRDLLDTLNDVLSEDVLASMAAEEQQHSAVRQGHKVRVSPCTQRQDTLLWASGRCEVTAYCGNSVPRQAGLSTRWCARPMVRHAREHSQRTKREEGGRRITTK
jgi:hypothetical protein